MIITLTNSHQGFRMAHRDGFTLRAKRTGFRAWAIEPDGAAPLALRGNRHYAVANAKALLLTQAEDAAVERGRANRAAYAASRARFWG